MRRLNGKRCLVKTSANSTDARGKNIHIAILENTGTYRDKTSINIANTRDQKKTQYFLLSKKCPAPVKINMTTESASIQIIILLLWKDNSE